MGSDTMWDVIGRQFGITEHVHFWFKYKTPLGNTQLTQAEFEEGWKYVLRANESLKRNNIEKFSHLLARNWFQVKNADAVYAIANYISFADQVKYNKGDSGDIVGGGTGWAVQMAIDEKKPVYIHDQHFKSWYRSLDGAAFFTKCDGPILCDRFAGIGTRDINDYSVEEIRRCYSRSVRKDFDGLEVD